MGCYLRNNVLLITLVLFFSACVNQEPKQKDVIIKKGEPNKTSAGAEVMRSTERILKQPIDTIHQPKNIEQLRNLIAAFKTCQLTDSTVRDSNFVSELIKLDSLLISSTKNKGIASHNNLIKQCVNCHSNYCPGPISRIKKIYK